MDIMTCYGGENSENPKYKHPQNIWVMILIHPSESLKSKKIFRIYKVSFSGEVKKKLQFVFVLNIFYIIQTMKKEGKTFFDFQKIDHFKSKTPN